MTTAKISKAIYFFVLLFAAVFAGNAEAQELKEPALITDVKSILKSQNLVTMPASINGFSSEKLQGYGQATDLVREAKKKRGELIGRILIYDNIREKFDRTYIYKNFDDNISLTTLFPSGFKPASTKTILNSSEYPLSEEESESARSAIESEIRVLNLSEYEKKLSGRGDISPQSVYSFYANAARKLESSLKGDIKIFTDYLSRAKEKIRSLAYENVSVDFRIGEGENGDGAKRNFERNRPMYIGFSYCSEGVGEGIPLEWKIKSPNGKIQMGKGKIEGSKKNCNFRIFSGKIGKNTPSGKYEVEVTLFPGESYQTKHNDTFSIKGVSFKVENAFVLGDDKKGKEIFKPGDGIIIAMQYDPMEEKEEKARFSWTILDPWGNEVPSLTVKKELSLRSTDKPVQTKYIKGIIPKNAPGGQYKFIASIEHEGNRENFETVTFTVKPARKN